MSDIFFLPLDRVIWLMKIIFSIKWHKIMEDTSIKVPGTTKIKWSSFQKLRRICEEDFCRNSCCTVSVAPATFCLQESRGWMTCCSSQLRGEGHRNKKRACCGFPAEKRHFGLESVSWLIKLNHERDGGYNGLWHVVLGSCWKGWQFQKCNILKLQFLSWFT